MIPSTQITNTEIFAFIDSVVFKLLSRQVLFINRKDNRNYWKVDYFLRKKADFASKLLQNFKQFECEIFRILLKHVSDHLSVLFQYAWLYL